MAPGMSRTPIAEEVEDSDLPNDNLEMDEEGGN